MGDMQKLHSAWGVSMEGGKACLTLLALASCTCLPRLSD